MLFHNNNRILAIDPGEKRIGIAISDLSGTIANPLIVIKHVSRKLDAKKIVGLIEKYDVKNVVMGISLDEQGRATFSGRRALRLGKLIMEKSNIPLEFWDEEGTTRKAVAARISMGVSRKKRQGHLDEVAAAIILQGALAQSLWFFLL